MAIQAARRVAACQTETRSRATAPRAAWVAWSRGHLPTTPLPAQHRRTSLQSARSQRLVHELPLRERQPQLARLPVEVDLGDQPPGCVQGHTAVGRGMCRGQRKRPSWVLGVAGGARARGEAVSSRRWDQSQPGRSPAELLPQLFQVAAAQICDGAQRGDGQGRGRCGAGARWGRGGGMATRASAEPRRVRRRKGAGGAS